MQGTCPLCGHDGCTIATERSGIWRLRIRHVVCQGCGFGYRSERWTPEEATHFYATTSKYYRDVYDSDRLHGECRLAQRAEARRRARLLQDHVAPPARVLDVGAGTGVFVAAALEAKFEAQGLELDEEGVADAQERGLPVELVSYEDGNWPPHSFDAITMFDVLEHSSDMRVFLRRSAELLRERGLLFIEVPEATSLNLKPEHYLIPEHNWHFTAGTLRWLLAQEGWHVVTETLVNVPRSPANTLSVVARRDGTVDPGKLRTGPGEHDRVIASLRQARHARIPLSAALRDGLIKLLGARGGMWVYRPIIRAYVWLKKLLGLYREVEF